MIVSATTNDVYEYVIGISPYDALERSLIREQRLKYEFYDEFIYDFELNKAYPQNDVYKKYMEEVSKLKMFVTKDKMKYGEIMRVAEEIAEIAPKHINIEYTEEDIK